ncbi:MAG: hypothetical protein RLZZ435_1686 [Cyanobacteriota bacterium]
MLYRIASDPRGLIRSNTYCLYIEYLSAIREIQVAYLENLKMQFLL